MQNLRTAHVFVSLRNNEEWLSLCGGVYYRYARKPTVGLELSHFLGTIAAKHYNRCEVCILLAFSQREQ